jgi:hypothetical protein
MKAGYRIRKISEVGLRPRICEEASLMLNGIDGNAPETPKENTQEDAHDD